MAHLKVTTGTPNFETNVGHMLVVFWGRLLVVCWPFVGRLLAVCWSFLLTYLMLFAGLMLLNSSGLSSRQFLFSIRACLVLG